MDRKGVSVEELHIKGGKNCVIPRASNQKKLAKFISLFEKLAEFLFFGSISFTRFI